MLRAVGFFVLLSQVTHFALANAVSSDEGSAGSASVELPSGAEFQLRIYVLTCNRAKSLQRLLGSLAAADYLRDRVDLEIYVDSPSSLVDRKSVVSASHDLSRDVLGMKEEVLKLSSDFKWHYGSKVVHERVINVGVLGQWIEAWYPAHNNQYALFLEDDVELSPFFYIWLKRAISHYHKPGHPLLGKIFGITMNKLSYYFSLDSNRGHLPVETKGAPFAYPILGTWGQLFFPDHWTEFRRWFRRSYSNPDYQPLVDGIINTQWYHMLGSKAWEQWVIKWAHDSGSYCIYSNFPHGFCLSTNHRELGNNYKEHLGPDCVLYKSKDDAQDVFSEIPTFFNYSLREVKDP